MSMHLNWPVALPTELHPYAPSAGAASLAWLDALGLPTEGLGAQGLAEGLGLAHPLVGRVWLRILVDWMHLYCLWDDAQEALMPTGAALALERQVVLCLGGGLSPTDDDPPLLRAAADLGARLLPLLDPAARMRFLGAVRQAAAGFAWEARARALGLEVSSGSLRSVALRTVGAEIWWELLLAAEGIHLPEEVLLSTPVARLRQRATAVLCLQHHVLSYARHRDQGDRMNLVALWPEGPVSGHIALCREHNALAEALMVDHTLLPLPLAHQRALRRFGEALARALGAHLRWATGSARALGWEEAA